MECGSLFVGIQCVPLTCLIMFLLISTGTPRTKSYTTRHRSRTAKYVVDTPKRTGCLYVLGTSWVMFCYQNLCRMREISRHFLSLEERPLVAVSCFILRQRTYGSRVKTISADCCWVNLFL